MTFLALTGGFFLGIGITLFVGVAYVIGVAAGAAVQGATQ